MENSYQPPVSNIGLFGHGCQEPVQDTSSLAARFKWLTCVFFLQMAKIFGDLELGFHFHQ
jgi:hypothetical protein